MNIRVFQGDITVHYLSNSIFLHQVNPRVLGPILAYDLSKSYPLLRKAFYQRKKEKPLVLGDLFLVRIKPDFIIGNGCGQITTISGKDNNDYPSITNYMYKALITAKELDYSLVLPIHIGSGRAGGSFKYTMRSIKKAMDLVPDKEVCFLEYLCGHSIKEISPGPLIRKINAQYID